MEKRVDLGQGGKMAVKWTGFSHLKTALTRLFPPDLTQVVDFPHKATVRLFWERGFYRRGAEAQSQEEERDRMDGMEERGRSDAFAFCGDFRNGACRTVHLSAAKCA